MKELAPLNQNKTRYMNFELLRIISMIMTLTHFGRHDKLVLY
jgi:hypothetical protein